MSRSPEPSSPDRALDLLAALLEEQARVARAEAALAAARRRLAALEERYRRLGQPLPPPGAAYMAAPAARRARRGRRREEGSATMRERILQEMGARRGEVFTPARLAPLVGAASRDSVRNTLLVLAAKGKIEKVGEGQYRAKGGEGGT